MLHGMQSADTQEKKKKDMSASLVSPETVQHVLVSCMKYESERKDMMGEMKIWGTTGAEVRTDWSVEEVGKAEAACSSYQ